MVAGTAEHCSAACGWTWRTCSDGNGRWTVNTRQHPLTVPCFTDLLINLARAKHIWRVRAPNKYTSSFSSWWYMGDAGPQSAFNSMVWSPSDGLSMQERCGSRPIDGLAGRPWRLKPIFLRVHRGVVQDPSMVWLAGHGAYKRFFFPQTWPSGR